MIEPRTKFRQEEIEIGYPESEYPSSVPPPPATVASRFDTRQSALSILQERLNTGRKDITAIRPEQRLAFAEAAHARVGEDSAMADFGSPEGIDVRDEVMEAFRVQNQNLGVVMRWAFQDLTDETIRQAIEDCIRRQLEIILNILGIKRNDMKTSSVGYNLVERLNNVMGNLESYIAIRQVYKDYDKVLVLENPVIIPTDYRFQARGRETSG